MKLFESEKTFAFLDINPLSLGHAVRLSVLSSSRHFTDPTPPPSSSSPNTTAPN